MSEITEGERGYPRSADKRAQENTHTNTGEQIGTPVDTYTSAHRHTGRGRSKKMRNQSSRKKTVIT